MGNGNREFSHEEAETNDEMTQLLFARRRCYFCMPGFASKRRPAFGLSWWQRMRTAEDEEAWWARGISALRKLRAWSGIVAGRRWKNFICRFNRKGRGGRLGKLQYDPLSYSLNFDDGSALDDNPEEDNDYGFRNFSARYASIPISAKHVHRRQQGPGVIHVTIEE